jgi:hypothetical protein
MIFWPEKLNGQSRTSRQNRRIKFMRIYRPQPIAAIAVISVYSLFADKQKFENLIAFITNTDEQAV